jgi:hypothetical protein
MALIIKAQPLRQSQNVWAALIALVQAEVLPRGMNLPANGIIRGVDLLYVGTVYWGGSVSTPPTGRLILSSIFLADFPQMGLSGSDFREQITKIRERISLICTPFCAVDLLSH